MPQLGGGSDCSGTVACLFWEEIYCDADENKYMFKKSEMDELRIVVKTKRGFSADGISPM